jgi:hypothetical protein
MTHNPPIRSGLIHSAAFHGLILILNETNKREQAGSEQAGSGLNVQHPAQAELG